MTAFTDFVKENYDKVRDLPSKERLKALSQMYKGEAKPTEAKIKKQKRP